MAESIKRSLIEKCRSGDVASFEKLFYLLKDNIYNVAFHTLGDHHDAEHITQEAFIKIWLNLKGFRMESSIRTWAYRITANLCCDLLEKRGRMPFAEEAVEGFRQLPTDENPLFLLTEKELSEKIQEAFSMLSPDDRLILTLRELEGLPYKEIAEVLDCSPGAAKMKVHRARLEFRKIISRYLEDG